MLKATKSDGIRVSELEQFKDYAPQGMVFVQHKDELLKLATYGEVLVDLVVEIKLIETGETLIMGMTQLFDMYNTNEYELLKNYGQSLILGGAV